ncbi:hypothetical protein [Cryobacterium sp. SO1]|nr:hypothetical protein [Cryobacterium sp. SO1]RZI35333.1 hypothetical protein BJQ95_02400 [Cryobacterium sp. SO1]
MTDTAEHNTAYIRIVDLQVADESNATPDRGRITHEGVDYAFGVELVDNA